MVKTSWILQSCSIDWKSTSYEWNKDKKAGAMIQPFLNGLKRCIAITPMSRGGRCNSRLTRNRKQDAMEGASLGCNAVRVETRRTHSSRWTGIFAPSAAL